MKFDGILIRYGELVLKGKNRPFFMGILKQNLEKILNVEVKKEFDRMFIPYQEEYLEKLKLIPGISSFSPFVYSQKNYEAIEAKTLAYFDQDAKSFRVSARRNDKTFRITSDELNVRLGSKINEVYGTKIQLKNPQINVIIEIRKEKVYILSKTYQGLGGIPSGSAGKVLHLLSGGFDSPVAAIELMKRGINVTNIAFITPPHTDEITINKLVKLQSVFKNVQGHSSMFLINYTDLMNYLSLVSDQGYKVTLMRRSFFRIASALASKYGFQALATGENLSQVASQTLESLKTISKETPYVVLRPLITYNKVDILELAKRYQTHDISVIRANETCELFAPKKPVIRPTIEQALLLEKEMEMIPSLEDEIIKNAKLIWY